MVLKDYQEQAIHDLELFLEWVDRTGSLSEAYAAFWEQKDVPAKPPYHSTLSGVPQVCFKVPTGGGKTFLAAASLCSIFLALPLQKSKMVVWLVPSDTILTQTYRNLNDPAHPYRQRIEADFAGRVAVYTKEQLLMAQNFSPVEAEEQLSILVLSYDSFRTSKKEGRKAYQENGQLYPFVDYFHASEELLPDADASSLIQVIRHYQPLVVVDESHHATTKLSVEMLQNFNPCFVLELTATPKPSSNVITYVLAARLKAANMVKLPVIVYNRRTRTEVIEGALDFRRNLEQLAKAEEMGAVTPVRPIVLFQAETKGKGDRATFDKIKLELVETYAIPAEQIAIKTADINELKGIELMAADCPIRYIITINALKEGWDCPFAYILASLANRTSSVDVEQILGRVLRRPYTKHYHESMLNMCYVFTASEDFRQTLDKVVAGLNAAGFSERDCRTVDETASLVEESVAPLELFPSPTVDDMEAATEIPPVWPSLDFSEKVPVAKAGTSYAIGDSPLSAEKTSDQDTAKTNELEAMQEQARQMGDAYDRQHAMESTKVRAPEELAKMKEFSMQEEFADAKELCLPQFFCRRNTGSLFEGETEEKLAKEMLCEGFSLRNKDMEIDFEHLDLEIASVDIYGNEDYPRYKKLSEADREFLHEYFVCLPLESQIEQCAGKIYNAIDRRKNVIPSKEIKDYIYRIVSAFGTERIHDAVQHTNAYIKKINDKIDALLAEHAKKRFQEQVDARKIFAKPSYRLPKIIAPPHATKHMVKSLYVAEADDMNHFEHRVITELAALDHVRWWHRNRERKEFCINGFLNHYPDFLVMMDSGVLLLVETKGDDRDNSDSKRKLELGKLWESRAGSDQYSYFMVFDKKPMEGALSFHDFLARVKEM